MNLSVIHVDFSTFTVLIVNAKGHLTLNSVSIEIYLLCGMINWKINRIFFRNIFEIFWDVSDADRFCIGNFLVNPSKHIQGFEKQWAKFDQNLDIFLEFLKGCDKARRGTLLRITSRPLIYTWTEVVWNLLVVWDDKLKNQQNLTSLV